MKKKLISLLLAALVAFSVPAMAMAAYETSIPITAVGNASNLIYIKRPQSLSASTSDKTYTISAVGTPGTKVRVYRYTGNNECTLVKAEKVIGASGLYSAVVDLPDNNNTFVVYAENGTNDQVVQIQLSKVKQSTIEKLKSITVNVLNFLR